MPRHPESLIMNYWQEPSIPTTVPPQLVRTPAPHSWPWEYAILREKLLAGGTAKCEILRPDSSGTLKTTGLMVFVRDRKLNSSSLSSYTQITIRQYGPTGEWDLDDWTCQYAV